MSAASSAALCGRAEGSAGVEIPVPGVAVDMVREDPSRRKAA